MITKLAALAVEMNEADLLSAKEAIKKQAQANVASAKQIDPLEDPEIDRYQYQPPSDAIVVEQTCSGTVVCDQCGGMIKDGDPSVWVRKVGPKKSQSMMLHRECCAR
jgi:formylmethanofuran dehydrogenase subunit E